MFGMHLKYLPPSPHPTHSAQITPYGRGKWEILIELHVACHTSRRLVRSLWGPRSSSCILSMAPGMCKMLRMPLSIPVSFNAVTDSLCFFLSALHFTLPRLLFSQPADDDLSNKMPPVFFQFPFPRKGKSAKTFRIISLLPRVVEHWTRSQVLSYSRSKPYV